jgi:hypothetical protein
MATFTNRMLGAARLDRGTYEEVEADTGATGQALGVVVLTGMASGLGLGAGVTGLVLGTLGTVLGWYVWAFIIYVVGTRWLPEPGTRADWGEVLRTVGFANAPGILRFLGVIPALRALVFFVTGVWVLVAVVIAVRSALDYSSTLRAVGVCVVGWLIQWLIFGLVATLLGAPPAV